MINSPIYFAACILAVSLLVRLPLFASIDPPTGGRTRVRTLDGLRGILALAVVGHHLTMYRQYLQTGQYTAPPSTFYLNLGQVGVSVFFMITGYLFWQKALAEKGNLAWIKLYVGRVFRIGPLHLVLMALLLVSVFARAGWQLNGTAFGFFKSFLIWLPMGFNGMGPALNHLPQISSIVAAQVWTLHYEWLFYLALLPLSVFARSRGLALTACSAALVGVLTLIVILRPAITDHDLMAVGLFLIGMAVASIQAYWPRLPMARRDGPSHLGSRHVGSLLVCGLTGWAMSFPTAYAAAPMMLLGIVFALVAWGCDPFGMLTSRSMARLGETSYGIYLLHGSVINAVFALGPITRFAEASPIHYWIVGLAVMGLAVTIASCTLVLVERPGIAWGRAAAPGIGAWLARFDPRPFLTIAARMSQRRRSEAKFGA